MFDEKKFRAALELSGVSIKELAKELGISKVTLYRKMNGKSDFYRDEIRKICEIIKTDDIVSIFFS